MRITSIIPTFAFALTCIMHPAWARSGLSFQTVALSGQAAPGAPGRIFSFYYPPAIGNSGRVAFAGWLTGSTSNDEGLWSGMPGAIQLVAREGSPAPGTTAVFANGWLFPRVNSSGVVAFPAALGFGADSTNNTGIWAGLPGTISLVARAGNPAPGTPAGVVFSGGMQNWLMLNDAGQLAFRANLAGPGVDNSNDVGIWAGLPGALQLIAREGSVAPGTGGGLFGPFNDPFVQSYPNPVLNAAGDVVFSGYCSAGHGIWRWSGGALELIALTGTTAPGTSVTFFDVFDPWMNASGQVVFGASLTGDGVDSMNNGGFWSGVPGAVELVVRKGSAAPGAAGRYLVLPATNIGMVSIQDDGAITFVAGLMDDGGVPNPAGSGIWRYTGPGAWGGTVVMVPETPAPGLPGVNFSGVRFFGPPQAGSIPFPSDLSGTSVNADNDESYWLKDMGSSPLMILREGSLFDVGGGVMRNIGQIDSSVQAYQGPGYTSSRRMVVGLHFWGGTSGIFAANVPVAAAPGDMNCDGAVNGLDVDAFVLAVLSPSAYAAEMPGCNILNGDINQDTQTGFADTDLFVGCVLNGGCQ